MANLLNSIIYYLKDATVKDANGAIDVNDCNFDIDTTAQTGSDDGDINAELTTLGWDSDVISSGKFGIKKLLAKMLGVPYVIEEGGTGVHTSWYYRKWSDGKLECWIKREWSTTISNAWGSLYYMTYTSTPAYPVSFLYNPVILASGTSTSGGAWLSVDKTTQSVTKVGNVYAISPTKVTSATDVFVNLYVVGRWR